MWKAFSFAALVGFVSGIVAALADDRQTCLDGQGDSAIAACTRVHATEPNQSYPLITRAWLYAKQGDFNQALRDADDAVRNYQSAAGAWAARCAVRAARGQLQDALSDCNKSLQMISNYGFGHQNRGMTYLKMGLLDQAINDLNSALATNPKDDDCLYLRGVTRLRKGDTVGGNADVAKAREINASISERYAVFGIRP